MKKNKLFRSFFIFLFLSIFFYIIITKLTDFKEAYLLLKITPIYLALAFLTWVLSYLALGLKLKILLKALGYSFKLKEVMKFGALGVFAIHFLPVGNFGESAFNFHIFRQRGVKTSSALALFLTRLVFDYLAFFSIFLVALICLKTRPTFNIIIAVAFSIILLMLFLGLLFFFYLLRRPSLFKTFAKRILKLMKKTFYFVKDKSKKDSEHYFDLLANHLYLDFKKIIDRKWLLLFLALISILYWLSDCGILFFSLWGLGANINFGETFFSYSLATIAGIISFLPAGIGAIEGTLVLILRSFSLNAPAITLGVFSYRFISLWLALPLGFLSFFSLNKKHKFFPQFSLSSKKK